MVAKSFLDERKIKEYVQERRQKIFQGGGGQRKRQGIAKKTKN